MSTPSFSLTLVPLGEASISVAPPLLVPGSPLSIRAVVEYLDFELRGERITARQRGRAAGNWLTLGPEGTATMDIRLSLETSDGALVFVQGYGRSDNSQGPGNAPTFCSWSFETGDRRYAWLNKIQAVSKGQRQEEGTFRASLYEVR